MREAGVALVAVLWVIGLLSLLAVTSLSMMRARTREATQLRFEVQATAHRDASAVEMTRRLVAGDPSLRPPLDGKPITLQVLGEDVTVAVSMERSRIDLNHADDATLIALFAGNGIAMEDAVRFLATLRDWQDPDDNARTEGGERSDYRAMGFAYGPRNGPLESTDEVLQLLNADRVHIRCFLSALTVYSGAVDVDPRSTSPLVRRALEWAKKNEWADRRRPDSDAAPGPTGETLAGQVLRLSVSSKSNDGRQHDLVLRLTGDDNAPYLAMSDEPTVTASTPDSCSTLQH